MIQRMYSIKDKLVGFLTPNTLINDDVAVRQFTIMVNSPNSGINPADDFDLFYIGDFDTEIGKMISTIPKIVISGREVKKHEMAD